MKKDDKTLLWVIGIMLIIINPGFILLAVIGLIVYSRYKDKYKLNEKVSKIKETVRNSDKAHNYEVIDTSAEVIESNVIGDEEWKATKEYKH